MSAIHYPPTPNLPTIKCSECDYVGETKSLNNEDIAETKRLFAIHFMGEHVIRNPREVVAEIIALHETDDLDCCYECGNLWPCDTYLLAKQAQL